MNLQAKDRKTSGRPFQIGVGVKGWRHSSLSTEKHLSCMSQVHLHCCVTVKCPAVILVELDLLLLLI